jgi:cytochrome c553
MRANAASLDDKTIQQLADYFASKKGDLVVKQY